MRPRHQLCLSCRCQLRRAPPAAGSAAASARPPRGAVAAAVEAAAAMATVQLLLLARRYSCGQLAAGCKLTRPCMGGHPPLAPALCRSRAPGRNAPAPASAV
eukprot:356295-Chlamydomonas_euryale.AAC.15